MVGGYQSHLNSWLGKNDKNYKFEQNVTHVKVKIEIEIIFSKIMKIQIESYVTQLHKLPLGKWGSELQILTRTHCKVSLPAINQKQ